MRSEKNERLVDMLYDAVIAAFKRKTDNMVAVANPVIKQVYENQGDRYENIMIPITDGKRMYRSGDLGYIQDDGNIVFLRRKDEQVMIKGQRVEPKEVENVLNTCTDVEKGVVVARRHNGNTSLIAYFVPKHSEKYSVESITDYLKSKLVDFMIPEYLVAMHTLPLTQNGKVDIAGLPYIYKSDRQ